MTGCGCGQQSKSGNNGGSLPGYGEQIEDLFEGEKRLTLLQGVQLLAGITTILLFLVYVVRN